MSATYVPDVVVYLGPDDGTPPVVPRDRADALRPLRIVRSVGSRGLDYAEFAVDLGLLGIRLVDLQTPLQWNRVVEVRIEPTDGSPPTLLFSGELTRQSLRIDERTEAVLATARLEQYLFGAALRGEVRHDPVSDTYPTVEVDARFNPEIDGAILPNMSPEEHPDRATRLWLDPEAVRTTAAQSLQGSTPDFWTLSYACEAACWTTNPDETYVRNADAFDDALAPPVRDVVLPIGALLPALLDRLLEPHGFGWWVRPSLDDGAAVRQIVVFRRGAGTEKAVRLQLPGERLDTSKSNLLRLEAATDLAATANLIDVVGALREREITIELYRGWEESGDALEPEDLDRTDPDSQYPAHRDAWRLWVANEAGDYTGLRTTVRPIPAVQDLAPVFAPAGTAAPQRRRLYDCLTLDAEGRRLPPQIEWWFSVDERWMPVPTEWQAVVLRDQIGVYFRGNQPPFDLVGEKADARIRVTGTIAGDDRIAARATSFGASANGRDVPLVIVAPERFVDRRVLASGGFKSRYADSGRPSVARTDTTEIQRFADDVARTEEPVGTQTACTISGLSTEYEIGDLITKVEGREISLSRTSLVGEPVYPQVVRIEWDCQLLETRLTLSEGR